MIVISSTALNFLQKDCIFRHVSGIKPSKPSKPSLGGAFFQVFFFLQVRQMIDDITDRPTWVDLKGKAPGPAGPAGVQVLSHVGFYHGWYMHIYNFHWV